MTIARPASNPLGDVDRVQRAHHLLAQAVGADKAGDHHHRQ